MASDPIPLSGLARRLVDDQIIDFDSATKASQEARKQGSQFVTFLVENAMADARTIAVSASRSGVPGVTKLDPGRCSPMNSISI